jgi:hypothetical protein
VGDSVDYYNGLKGNRKNNLYGGGDLRGNFSEDRQWMEAKRMIKDTNWIEIVNYYHAIGGKNVMVYSIHDREKCLIIDVLEGNNVAEDRVLVLTPKNEVVAKDYEEVLNSRKQFSYADNIERLELDYKGTEIIVHTERR